MVRGCWTDTDLRGRHQLTYPCPEWTGDLIKRGSRSENVSHGEDGKRVVDITTDSLPVKPNRVDADYRSNPTRNEVLKPFVGTDPQLTAVSAETGNDGSPPHRSTPRVPLNPSLRKCFFLRLLLLSSLRNFMGLLFLICFAFGRS